MGNFWGDSIELMLLGMGTVFVFLSLLVVGMIVMSALINLLNTEEPANDTHTKQHFPEAEIAAVAVSAWAKSQNN